ncbi:MAG: ethanolamine utilization protein EutH [Clostridia bacterium]|nr:ethanolamine utilization protein EutH [Clostridia bacterium]
MQFTFDRIVIIIMAFFAVIGGLDRIFGNRLKLGTSFENGIKTMGELALSMIGIIVLAPVIAKIMEPVVVPVYRFLGADPAMFAGTILACDMGGAPLARELTQNADAARLGGMITGSMLGGTISFTIPVAMSVLSPADRKFAAKGILCGVVTVPLGVFLGGIVAGMNVILVLKNIIPIAIVSILIALGLWKAEKFIIKAFEIFGKFIIAVATVGLVAAGIELTTDIVVIPGLASMTEAFSVVGEIAVVLAGAFPLVAIITRVLNKPMGFIGKKFGMNAVSVSGLIATLPNSLATFDLVKDMDDRGKVVNMAFAVSAAFVFGDHLAFSAGYDPEMILPLIAGKLCAGFTAVCLALLITKEKKHV